MPQLDSVQALEARSDSIQAALRAQLAVDENVLATLAVDLESSSLHFGQGMVALTDQRLLSLSPIGDTWTTYSLSADLSLRSHDHGGVGTLELLSPSARLAFLASFSASTISMPPPIVVPFFHFSFPTQKEKPLSFMRMRTKHYFSVKK